MQGSSTSPAQRGQFVADYIAYFFPTQLLLRWPNRVVDEAINLSLGRIGPGVGVECGRNVPDLGYGVINVPVGRWLRLTWDRSREHPQIYPPLQRQVPAAEHLRRGHQGASGS